jgi:iron complex outermembrane receptor protein
VVNFITKRSFEGASAPLEYVQPKHSGGGDEQRATHLRPRQSRRDGWNIYATVDAHRRTRLLRVDRAYLSTPELLTSIGRAPTLGSGGNATPANFTTATNKTARQPVRRGLPGAVLDPGREEAPAS